jgi:hypothetical protein
VADAHALPIRHPSGQFQKKVDDGKVVALDFRATHFLPPSLFAVAIAKTDNNFTRKAAKRVNYPKSDDFAAMLSASHCLVSFGRNDIGQPDSFSFYLD